jgi:Phospholipase_D-nuclease N-terminal/Short C-terminal domain
MLAADYPFLDLLWTMFIFFLWVMWFWLVITVFADIFRRRDISGWSKTLWCIFVIVLPFIGVFAYLISQNEAMTERNLERARADRAQFDDYVRTTAGADGAAAEIERASKLRAEGVIDDAEFEAIKRKALA